MIPLRSHRGRAASFYQAQLGDERFYRQLAQEATRATPLTPEEERLLQLQKRNRGVELPEFTRMRLDRAYELQRLEAEDYRRANPIRAEDAYDASTRGNVGRRASQERSRRNKPHDASVQLLRPPGQSGPMPWSDEPTCTTAPWAR